MNIVLLSGGSGRRLWPLSNDIRSKQFLKLLRNQYGQLQSMIQRVCGQIREAGIHAKIVISTGMSQADIIVKQLGKDVDIVIEPERRDTFPAILLACSYLANVKRVGLNEPVIILPVDPYVDVDYFKTLIKLECAINRGVADIVLMGIKATHPSSSYGYIIPGVKDNDSFLVESFAEKPEKEDAEKYICQGAYWNSGVFGFRLGYVQGIINGCIPGGEYNDVREHYCDLRKTSFDYEVVEKAQSVAMIPYAGRWKDLGSWKTVTEEMNDSFLGKGKAINCSNTNVINELSIPAIAIDTKNLIIVASPDGILISDKDSRVKLKEIVADVVQKSMYEENYWGSYKVLDYFRHDNDDISITGQLAIDAGKQIGHQIHRMRDEIWTITQGTGEALVDGKKRSVRRGDVIYIKRGQKHQIRAKTDLVIIEVRIGEIYMEDEPIPAEFGLYTETLSV